MYNPEQPQQPKQPPLMAPRMSFSSDFALEPPPPPPPSGAARAGDADFEFTPVGSRPMIAADQLFSKGRILPLREARGPVTLRDELLMSAPDAGGTGGRRVPRWKELLGLNKRSSSHKQKGAAPAADAHADLGGHGDTGQ